MDCSNILCKTLCGGNSGLIIKTFFSLVRSVSNICEITNDLPCPLNPDQIVNSCGRNKNFPCVDCQGKASPFSPLLEIKSMSLIEKSFTVATLAILSSERYECSIPISVFITFGFCGILEILKSFRKSTITLLFCPFSY